MESIKECSKEAVVNSEVPNRLCTRKWLQTLGLDSEAEDFKNGVTWRSENKPDLESHETGWKKVYNLYKDEIWKEKI